MIEVVGIVFEKGSRIYYFSPNGESKYQKNDRIIVETDRGLQIGTVIQENITLHKSKLKLPLKSIYRIANDEDEKTQIQNKEEAKKAISKVEKLVTNLRLDMKIVDAEFTLDKRQLMFHFLSENRIDFRELVKEIAKIYKTRIELRQIGIRDKAKNIGGIGVCGRELCCSKFLTDFDNVSINMAKNQNIALNPTKINGSCGRLLCCLNYENDLYSNLKKELPLIGEIINTKEGKGKVVAINVLKQAYKLQLENNEIIEIIK